MKFFKKITSAVVALAMVVTLCAINPTKAEAKVKVYTGKKVTMTVGGSDRIYTNAKKAKFKSSNKKIVTVSSKGKLKGKKAGAATIKITSEKGSANVKVTVLPKRVTLKSAALTSANANSVKVTWNKVSGATGYYVYYATSKSGKFTKMNVKGGKKTTATVTNLVAGNTYYFKVKAYVKSGKKIYTSESYSKNVIGVKTWKLVWSDEFNGKTLDTNVWTYETDADDTLGGWGNQEEQHYTAGNNVKFDGKNLIIVPRMEIQNGKRYITSTRIKSKDKKEFTYGKIEIRAKSTNGQGTWSAGWMLGNNGTGWPNCGEIDILEAMNGGVPQTIHCPYFNNQPTSHGNKNYSTGLSQAQCAADYHTFGAIWTKDYIQFTVDGKNNPDKGGCYNPTMYSPSVYDQTWVFDHNFFFILNCAVGGNAAGKVGTNGWTLVSNKNNKQVYEDYFYIDYVRVYK